MGFARRYAMSSDSPRITLGSMVRSYHALEVSRPDHPADVRQSADLSAHYGSCTWSLSTDCRSSRSSSFRGRSAGHSMAVALDARPGYPCCAMTVGAFIHLASFGVPLGWISSYLKPSSSNFEK